MTTGNKKSYGFKLTTQGNGEIRFDKVANATALSTDNNDATVTVSGSGVIFSSAAKKLRQVK